MKIIPASFVNLWEGRIWNLHPSLLPSFPGAHAITESFEAKAPMGVSIHEVTAEMDSGPVALQKHVADPASNLLSLDEAKLKISITEQRLVREWSQRRNAKWI